MTFVPHLVLVALAFLWVRGMRQVDVAMVVVAALLPLWVLWTQRAYSLGRAILLGPVTMLAIAAAAWILWDADERDWLMKLLAGVALLAYAIYNLVIFAIAAWWRRRRRKRSQA